VNPNLRACIANLAGRLSGQSVNSSVYDHTQGRHIRVSGSATIGSVSLYDHDHGAHLTGVASSLYDHVSGAQISLNLSGTRFNGYDHSSRCQYFGNIRGASVTIYDHESGRHHQYSV